MRFQSFKITSKWSNFEASGELVDFLRGSYLIRSSDYHGYHPQPQEKNWDRIWHLSEEHLDEIQNHLRKEQIADGLFWDGGSGKNLKSDIRKTLTVEVIGAVVSQTKSPALPQEQALTQIEALQELLTRILKSPNVREVSIADYENLRDEELSQDGITAPRDPQPPSESLRRLHIRYKKSP